jgi:hypothetical protein
MSPTTKVIPNPPFQWNQLSPRQQEQISRLLAQLLTQYLTARQIQAKKEAAYEPPPQNQ